MNVVVVINGREAIPVRAIPLISGWKLLHPESVTLILAKDEDYVENQPVEAYHRQDGTVHPISPKQWVSFSQKLKVLSNNIKATQIDHKTGYQEWKDKSLSVLPAGVFVWKDELAAYHYGRHGPRGVIHMDFRGEKLSNSEREALVALNFNPLIEDPEIWRLVMEGFEPQQAAPQIPTVTPDTAPATQGPPVVPAKDVPLPLTTGDIAFCFAGLRWKTEDEWKKPLGDKPKWLKACISIPGKRGVSETRWNPVLIGGALVSGGHAGARSVRAKFQSNHLLTPWLEQWNTYEADNLDTN